MGFLSYDTIWLRLNYVRTKISCLSLKVGYLKRLAERESFCCFLFYGFAGGCSVAVCASATFFVGSTPIKQTACHGT